MLAYNLLTLQTHVWNLLPYTQRARAAADKDSAKREAEARAVDAWWERFKGEEADAMVVGPEPLPELASEFLSYPQLKYSVANKGMRCSFCPPLFSSHSVVLLALGGLSQ